MFLKLYSTWNVAQQGIDLMLDHNRFDSVTGNLCVERIIIRRGKRKNMRFFVRLYNYTELRDLLSRAGLNIRAAYGDWQGTPFSTASGRMIIVAEKI